MTTATLTDARHYENLPMCGYCMNAWDIIYMRHRPGTTSAQKWVGFCKVGGCDPDVWDHIDENTGWPHGFIIEDGHVDWPNTVELYEPPDHDNRVFHMRLSDGPGAEWRRMMPKLVATFYEVKGNGRFKGKGGTVPDELIKWDDDDDETVFDDEEVGTPNVSNAPVDILDDDDIEW